LASSLGAGLARLPRDADGAVVMLADMPFVSSAIIDRIVDAFSAGKIIVPTFEGRRGNPVLWPRELFPSLHRLAGDVGSRTLFDAHRTSIVEIPMGTAVTVDVDTPRDFAILAHRDL
jgi:molybdenum cofactor cytidylyltransferase